MSIFVPTPTDQPTPAQQAAASLIQMVQETYAFVGTKLAIGQDMLWNNGTATPDEIIAALGTDAAAVYMAGVALQAFINEQVPNTNTFAAPRAGTINPDGSLTLAPAP
jgi:hypothetical protein